MPVGVGSQLKMSKRAAPGNEDGRKTSKQSADTTPSKAVDANGMEDDEMGEFEDPYGDDFESEEEIFEAGGSEDEDDDEQMDGGREKALQAIKEDEEQEEGDDDKDKKKAISGAQVYLPNLSEPLGPNETMEPDLSVYDMLHTFNVEWPCLSFDIIPDHLGNERKNYPQTTYMVTGTQASRSKNNEITVMKLSSLSKTLLKDDSDNEDDDEDEEESDPILESRSLSTPHTTNRIRVSPHGQKTGEHLAASMSESGDVYVWDITPHVKSFDTPGTKIEKSMNRPAHTIRNHGNVEGYAIDWSPTVQTGALLTGDCDGRIFFTRRTQSGWTTDKTAFSAGEMTSSRSVEDLQWSPSQNTVFASCGSDGFIRIWDTRSKSHKPQVSVRASNTDVNVISWNPVESSQHLICSGDDAGRWGVWDLRSFSPNSTSSTVATFDFHKKPITSIEFHPSDPSVVAVASEDNTVTLWDLSVEADDEESGAQDASLTGVPPQLLFVHWQRDAKEVHWNKQIPGALGATGGDGFSIFKTISV